MGKSRPPASRRAPADDGQDERVRKSKKKILDSALHLLMQDGLTGISVDAVSRRSGVAKTTIYRHWPSRSELLVDVCGHVGGLFPPSDTGSLKGDLTVLALGLAQRLRDTRIGSVLPSIIDEAEHDPDFAKVHARLHAERVTPFKAAVERALKRGELSSERDASHVVAAVVGPLFYRRWLSREPLDEAFVKAIVAKAVRA